MTQEGAQEIIDNDSPLNWVTGWSGIGKITGSVVGQINGCVLAMCLAEVTSEKRKAKNMYMNSKYVKSGYYRAVSETPSEWRFAGGPIVARDCMLAGPSKHRKAGHYRPASGTPSEWCFAGGPIVARDICWLGVQFHINPCNAERCYLCTKLLFNVHHVKLQHTSCKHTCINIQSTDQLEWKPYWS